MAPPKTSRQGVELDLRLDRGTHVGVRGFKEWDQWRATKECVHWSNKAAEQVYRFGIISHLMIKKKKNSCFQQSLRLNLICTESSQVNVNQRPEETAFLNVLLLFTLFWHLRKGCCSVCFLHWFSMKFAIWNETFTIKCSGHITKILDVKLMFDCWLLKIFVVECFFYGLSLDLIEELVVHYTQHSR